MSAQNPLAATKSATNSQSNLQVPTKTENREVEAKNGCNKCQAITIIVLGILFGGGCILFGTASLAHLPGVNALSTPGAIAMLAGGGIICVAFVSTGIAKYPLSEDGSQKSSKAIQDSEKLKDSKDSIASKSQDSVNTILNPKPQTKPDVSTIENQGNRSSVIAMSLSSTISQTSPKDSPSHPSALVGTNDSSPTNKPKTSNSEPLLKAAEATHSRTPSGATAQSRFPVVPPLDVSQAQQEAQQEVQNPTSAPNPTTPSNNAAALNAALSQAPLFSPAPAFSSSSSSSLQSPVAIPQPTSPITIFQQQTSQQSSSARATVSTSIPISLLSPLPFPPVSVSSSTSQAPNPDTTPILTTASSSQSTASSNNTPPPPPLETSPRTFSTQTSGASGALTASPSKNQSQVTSPRIAIVNATSSVASSAAPTSTATLQNSPSTRPIDQSTQASNASTTVSISSPSKQSQPTHQTSPLPSTSLTSVASPAATTSTSIFQTPSSTRSAAQSTQASNAPKEALTALPSRSQAQATSPRIAIVSTSSLGASSAVPSTSILQTPLSPQQSIAQSTQTSSAPAAVLTTSPSKQPQTTLRAPSTPTKSSSSTSSATSSLNASATKFVPLPLRNQQQGTSQAPSLSGSSSSVASASASSPSKIPSSASRIAPPKPIIKEHPDHAFELPIGVTMLEGINALREYTENHTAAVAKLKTNNGQSYLYYNLPARSTTDDLVVLANSANLSLRAYEGSKAAISSLHQQLKEKGYQEITL